MRPGEIEAAGVATCQVPRRSQRAARALGLITVLIACVLIGHAFEFASRADAAATTYVNGISDEDLASWYHGSESYFGKYFKEVWDANNGSGHIQYARKVVLWELEATGGATGLIEWLEDAHNLGLTPEIAPTAYPGHALPDEAQYKAELSKIISLVRQVYGSGSTVYIEPWNEPNAQGELNKGAYAGAAGAERAAEYAYWAKQLCSGSCQIVAGNFEDSAKSVEYASWYIKKTKALGFIPDSWGIHPYKAIEQGNDAEALGIWNLIRSEYSAKYKGGEPSLSITEIGDRQCTSGFVPGAEAEEDERGRERAKYLVDELMPALKPERVFYWEFMYGNNEAPLCGHYDINGNEFYETDNALYVPNRGSEPEAAPRPAAALIYDNSDSPWGYTSSAPTGLTPTAADLAGVVYSGDLSAGYTFEYGPTASYGTDSPEDSVAASTSGSAVRAPVSGLSPGTTYHYRLIAHRGATLNASEVSGYGSDVAFTTPSEPKVATEDATLVGETDATLHGEVNPEGFDGYSASFRFEYGITTAYGRSMPTPEGAVGSGTAAVPEAVTVGDLQPGVTYHYRLVATNAWGTAYGQDKVFTTAHAVRPSITPSGTAIVWRGSDGHIYETDAPGGAWTSFSPTWSARGIPTGVTPAGNIVVTPSGNALVWRGSDGNIYETDAPAGEWESFSPTWAKAGIPPGVGAVSDPVVSPSGAAIAWIGSDGNIYETDAPAGTWESFSPTWSKKGIPAGVTAVGDPVFTPSGDAIIWRGSDGNLYETDAPAGEWESFSPTWSHIGIPTGVMAVSDPVVTPSGDAILWLGSDGNVYETDAPEGKWESFSPTWSRKGIPAGVAPVGDPTVSPAGTAILWLGSDGNVYETDAPEGKWESFSPTWSRKGIPAGVAGTGDVVALPSGEGFVWRGSDGNIYETSATAGEWGSFSPTWSKAGLPSGVTVARNEDG